MKKYINLSKGINPGMISRSNFSHKDMFNDSSSSVFGDIKITGDDLECRNL